MIVNLETDRLLLRKYQASDIDDFFANSRNPNIGPRAGWKPHETREESAKILAAFITGEEVWAITFKSTGKVIGSIGLHQDSMRTAKNVKSIGYVLAEEYWGQGIMTEAVKRVMQYAFEELQVDLLSVGHYPFNKGSQRVIEKCGFKYEGRIRMASQIYDGSIYDLMSYSMTRDEWH